MLPLEEPTQSGASASYVLKIHKSLSSTLNFSLDQLCRNATGLLEVSIWIFHRTLSQSTKELSLIPVYRNLFVLILCFCEEPNPTSFPFLPVSRQSPSLLSLPSKCLWNPGHSKQWNDFIYISHLLSPQSKQEFLKVRDILRMSDTQEMFSFLNWISVSLPLFYQILNL